jgi:hypothetical protein
MRASEFTSKLNENMLITDVPNEDWLEGKIWYAKEKGRNSFGVPYMGSSTAFVRPNPEVSVDILKRLPGMRGEQSNVRHEDLKAIMKIMKDTGKLPLMKNGKEYAPFINVAFNGEAWVNEGNHRIMAAAALGWDKLPIEIRYFDGGERIESGPMYPPKIGAEEPKPGTKIIMNVDEGVVDEAELGTPEAKEIVSKLKQAGYKQLGSGADATVWSKDVGQVIKVIMPDSKDITQAAYTFKKFYEFCQQHKDIACLPKFIPIQGKDYVEFKLGNKNYIQVSMEQLYPIKEESFAQGIVWFFSDYVANNTKWDKVDKLLSLPKTWYDFHTDKANQYALSWANLKSNKNKYAEIQLLYTVMELLYRTGRLNKMYWDLHTDNAMQRKDGTVVIIDPWFERYEGTL